MRFVVSGGTALIALVAAAVGTSYLFAESTAPAAMPPVHVDTGGAIPKLLSEYNLFIDNARQIPNEGVVPYDLNSPLFSDYTEKHRFVYVPPGHAAQYDEVEAFEFPVGSVLVKTFGMLHDMRDPALGERILETRLLVRKESGWVGLPYVWRDDMSDADLKVAGGTVGVEWIHSDGSVRSNNYILPNMNQCKGCHNTDSNNVLPIGPKARHLNKEFEYAHGAENQLAHWTRIGYLEGAPDHEHAPRLAQAYDPESDTIKARARAYLDINCGHCHNPQGPASNSGLWLFAHVDEPLRLGVFKTPVAAGRGSGGLRYSIVPGEPDESIMIYRLDSTEPGVMMPELPRRMVDEEGLALLRAWIDEMPADYGGGIDGD